MPKSTPPTARSLAVSALTRVIGNGQALDEVLAELLVSDAGTAAGRSTKVADHRDPALVRELCFGTLRWYWRLAALLKPLLKKPLKAKDRDLEVALLLGLYQLLYTRIPPHAAIHATVDVAAARGKPWARGLLNGVLRRFAREQQQRSAELDAAGRDAESSLAAAACAHPQWLFDTLREAYPQHWPAIIEANNQRPPMTLRNNQQRGTRDAWAAELAAASIASRAVPDTSDGLILEQAQAPLQLPGFAEGRGSVQDGAAQLCAPLLELAAGQRVLDACAAPGGKTGHILEQQAGLAELVAVDRVGARLQPLRDNLQRLDLKATVIDADARDPASWWDGQGFDRILLDAPCSGTGVIRRHPDIRVLRRGSDPAALAARQFELLEALWPLLADGGILLYVTCSLLPEENERVVSRFLDATPTATEQALTVPWGQARRVGRQVLPGEQDMDGFYFARLRRQ